MENTPLISVIMPVFNVEKFIHQALTSLINQTYFNLEIIIVDDGSTDTTPEIVNQFTCCDTRIKFIQNRQNCGIVFSMNLALQHANGQFIARMDGDDISHPDRIEILYNFLRDNPQISLVGSQTETIDELGNIINRPHWPTDEKKVVDGLKLQMSTVLHYWLARREVYTLLGGYRIPTAEDYDFLLRMISHQLRFTNIGHYLYQARIRSGNTASAQGLKQRLSARYAWKLFQERSKMGITSDSWNQQSYAKATAFSPFREKCFKKAAYWQNKAVIHRQSRLLFLIYMALSTLSSPFSQLSFIRRRQAMKALAQS